jgi:hypothetical protein
MSKHLTKLFPNKVTIETPQVWHFLLILQWLCQEASFNFENMLQDESELTRWKQLLDRDIEILKAKANVLKIQSVSIWCEGIYTFPFINYSCLITSLSLAFWLQ